MWYLIFGGLLVFTGFYLIIKGIFARKKGEHIPARFVGFSNEKGNSYPLFNFKYNGEDLTISGAVPVERPDSYKHEVGDTVNIIYVPGNNKYVDIEGSYTDFLWAVGSILVGAVLIFLYFRQ